MIKTNSQKRQILNRKKAWFPLSPNLNNTPSTPNALANVEDRLFQISNSNSIPRRLSQPLIAASLGSLHRALMSATPRVTGSLFLLFKQPFCDQNTFCIFFRFLCNFFCSIKVYVCARSRPKSAVVHILHSLEWTWGQVQKQRSA